MRITVELVEELGQAIRLELSNQAAREGIVATCDAILKSFSSATTQSDPKSLIEQIFRIIWFFESATQKVNASHKTCNDLTRMAEYSLNILGVKPYKSKLSFLYRSLYNARAQFFSHHRDAWLAVWSLQVGEAMDGADSNLSDDKQREALEIEATQYFRCGFVTDAVALFQKAESFAKKDKEIWPLRINVVRCLRLLDQPNLALDALATLQNQQFMSEELKIAVAWETALLTSQQEQSLSPVLEMIEKGRKDPQPIHFDYLPLAVLWCYASKQRAALDQLPSASSLKSRRPSTQDLKAGVSPIKLISHLEDFYFDELSIFHKLKSVGEILGELRSEPASVELVLFFAAVARWLLRFKQRRTAALAINIYQSLSSTISNGRTVSLFHVLDDIGDSLNASAEISRAVTLTNGVKSGFERTLLYIEIMTKLFTLAIISTIKKFKSNHDEQSYKKNVVVKVSEFFVKYASGAMKGPIHKLGQFMLNFVDLPEEAKENFKSVLWSKAIVHETLMRRVLEEELKGPVDRVFAKFDWNPVGVGSVSQVYRAELKTGEEVAVKIQYPDLAKIVKQDLDMFSRMLPALGWLFPRHDLRDICRFLADIYQRETNFLIEVEIAKVLDSIIERGARWRIPRFFTQFCSQRVLVSEFVSGMNFYEFSENASTDERIDVAKAIHQFFMLSLIEGRIICLDPHPANLIVRQNEIVMIDFGCFLPISSDFVALARDVQFSYEHVFDYEKMLDRQFELYRKFEILESHPDVQDSDVREFVALVAQQMNWEKCAQPGQLDRFRELYLKCGINKVFGSKKPEFVVAYLSIMLMFRTISKFAVRHSPSHDLDIATEIKSRIDQIDDHDYSQAG